MLVAPAFQLPPPPPGFHRFAWQGIALLLPAEWNLTRHEGNARRGALVFADLRATRLLVRWKTPGHRLRRLSPAAALERTWRRLKEKPSAVPDWLPPKSIYLSRPTSTLVLLADARRLYELEWPEPDGSCEATLRDFAGLLPQLSAAPAWPWHLYGISAWLPVAARLTQSSLLPGETSLRFALGSVRTHLQSHSLADRLLLNSSLRQWARHAVPLLHSHPSGDWCESPSALHYQVCVPGRLFRRTRQHDVTLSHDPIANQIHWTHTSQRATTPQATPAPLPPPATTTV